jgi:hypothetical protein
MYSFHEAWRLRDCVRGSRRRGLVVEVLETRRLLATSTVKIVPSSNSPTYGDSLTFTATVAGSDPGGPTPTGTVQFLLDGTPVGPAFPLSNGAFTTPAIAAPPIGAHSVAASYSGDSTYQPSTGTLALTVRPAPLTIKADDKSKAAGAPNPPFTATYSGFVNGEGPGNLVGTLTFATTATDASPPGKYPITPGGLTSTNYAIAFVPGTITIFPPGSVGETVTLVPSSTSSTYGNSLTFTATVAGSDSGGPTPTGTVQFFLDGNPVGPAFPLQGGTVTTPGIATLPAGVHSVVASYSGDTTYGPGTATPVPLTIHPAPLSVNAVSANKVYGQANPTFTGSFSSFVLGQNPSVLGGALTFTSPATTASHVGQYPIIPGGLTSSNYAITFHSSTLLITPASLKIIADSRTYPQGQPGPLTATYVGFVNGDTPASLTTPPKLLTNATSSSPPGNYPIMVQGASSPDYFISYANGTLTIVDPPPTPAAPMLAPQTDTGVSNSDGITRDNGSAAAPLAFIIPSASNALDYRLYDVTDPNNPVLIAGPAPPTDGAVIVSGNALSDGVHQVLYTSAAGTSGTQSVPSAPASITIQSSLRVISVSPPDGSFINGMPNGPVVVTFNHTLVGLNPSGAPLTGNNLYDVILVPVGPDGQSGPPSGIDGGVLPVHNILSYHDNGDGTSSISLTPTELPSTDIYAIGVGGVSDVAGNPVTGNQAPNPGPGTPYWTSFELQISPFDPNTAPRVSAVTTLVQANGSSVNVVNNLIPQPDTIGIQFSKPMNMRSFTTSTVQLLDSANGYAPVAAGVTYSPSTRTVYLTPEAALVPGRNYVIKVAGSVNDDQKFPAAGNALQGGTYYTSFSVNAAGAGAGQSPLRVVTRDAQGHLATTPSDGMLWTQPVGYVSVPFSEPLDMSSFGRYSATLVPQSGGFLPMNAKLAFNPNTDKLIIVPFLPMGNDLYAVSLYGGIRATNGDPLLPGGMTNSLPVVGTFMLQVGGSAASIGSRSAAEHVVVAVAAPSTTAPAPVASVTPAAVVLTKAADRPLAAVPHRGRPAQTAPVGPRRGLPSLRD